VNGIFELKNILIEGHARDMRLHASPRGIQLILGTKSYPSMVDTIVMANLGYFQLKANPGVWDLKLRSGRSSELYQIINIGNNVLSWLEERNDELVKHYEEFGITIALTSFEGSTVFLRVCNTTYFYFILFYFILFYFILFYFILFYFILFYFFFFKKKKILFLYEN